MAPAADIMAEALSSIRMNTPIVPLVANVTASEVSDAAEIRRLLVEQVTGMVRWRESVLFMRANGVDQLVEIGNGKVLSGLVRRIDADMTAQSICTPEDVEAFLKSL
jgi:[acyl-carrier-protein] S-malonyltransferase